MTELTVGTKFDQGKLRWDLIPPEFEEVVKVITYGATKYEDRNWERGINYGRLIAATLRHLYAWIRGETNDPETGLHHLAHAGCDLMFLLTYEMRGMNAFDDRAIRRRDEQPISSLSGIRVQHNVSTTQIPDTRWELGGRYGIIVGASQDSDRQDPQPSVDPLSESVHNAP